MKAIISALLCLAMALSISAQGKVEHLKFMGIPLTGTINAFQAKLFKKGCKVDKVVNKYIPTGSRAFSGTFAGYDATIFVYYDKDTKIVYRAKAVYTESDSDIAANRYGELEAMLRTKYSGSNCYISDGTNDGYDSICVHVYDSNNDSKIGIIDLYRTDAQDSPYSIDLSYPIHIDYYDEANNSDHIDNKMDDL